jgi:hypothetical protein
MSRGRDTASFPPPRGRAAKILLQRKLSYRRRPLTALRVLPSIAGADKQSRSRDAPHPSGFNKRLRKPRISPFFLRFTDRKKKEAERRQAPGKKPPHLRVRLRALIPYSSPACGGDREGEHARLSAFHRGSRQRDAGPKGSAPGLASWDAGPAGVTRHSPVPVQ